MRAAIITRIKGWCYAKGPKVKTTPRPQGWTMSIEDEQRWHRIIRKAA